MDKVKEPAKVTKRFIEETITDPTNLEDIEEEVGKEEVEEDSEDIIQKVANTQRQRRVISIPDLDRKKIETQVTELIGTDGYEGWYIKINRPAYRNFKLNKVYPDRDLHTYRKPISRVALETNVSQLYGGGKYIIYVHDETGSVHSHFPIELDGQPIEDEEVQQKATESSVEKPVQQEMNFNTSSRLADLQNKIQETKAKAVLKEAEQELKELEGPNIPKEGMDSKEAVVKMLADIEQQKSVNERFEKQQNQINDISLSLRDILSLIRESGNKPVNTDNQMMLMMESMKSQTAMVVEAMKHTSIQQQEQRLRELEEKRIESERRSKTDESLEKQKIENERIRSESIVRQMEVMNSLTNSVLQNKSSNTETFMKLFGLVIEVVANRQEDKGWIKQVGEVVKDLMGEAAPLVAAFKGGKIDLNQLAITQESPIPQLPQTIEQPKEDKPELLQQESKAPGELNKNGVKLSSVEPKIDLTDKDTRWKLAANELAEIIYLDSFNLAEEPEWLDYAIAKLPKDLKDYLLTIKDQNTLIAFCQKYIEKDRLIKLFGQIKKPEVQKWITKTYLLLKNELKETQESKQNDSEEVEKDEEQEVKEEIQQEEVKEEIVKERNKEKENDNARE
jgi:hypothetical protein